MLPNSVLLYSFQVHFEVEGDMTMYKLSQQLESHALLNESHTRACDTLRTPQSYVPLPLPSSPSTAFPRAGL